MYLALALAPWVLAFALSNIAINHEIYGEDSYETVKDEVMTKTFDYAGDNRALAKQVLEELGMLGNFWIDGRRTSDQQLSILRDSSLNPARITYFHIEQRVLVERQKITAGHLMASLHRGGFGSEFMANHLWGIFVDALVISMLFWALSGLYMWWELKTTRKLGFVSISSGVILFVVLVLFL